MKNKILELEALRALASFYVFLGHSLNRFIRIYPIVFFAYLISAILLILDKLNLNLNASELILNLLMFQDISSHKPGVWADPLFGNSPLWSLSYEWWFYIIFFFHFSFIKDPIKLLWSGFLISVIGSITYSFYYNQISLFLFYYLLWLIGAVIFLSYQKMNKIYLNLILKITLTLIVSILLFLLLNKNVEFNEVGQYPLLQIRHFLGTSILLFIVYIFYRNIDKVRKNYLYIKLISLLSVLAPISFGVYVVHYPIINYLSSYSSIYNSLYLFLLCLIITLILAFIAEIKLYVYLRKKFIKKVNNG